ncbi:hypothetical protein SH449x_003438 [Pirellulaceae bacterium SH449]
MLSSWWLLVVAVATETFAGVFILVGPALWSWRVAMVFFALLACFASYSLWTGQDCNCFGSKIGSNVTLPLDLIILLLGGLFPPRPCPSTPQNRLPRALGYSTTAAVVLSVGLTLSATSARTDDPLQFLLADSMLGKEWPLTKQHHAAFADLEQGRWLVLLVREDCAHCRELVQTYFTDPTSYRKNERIAMLVSQNGQWHIWFDQVSWNHSDQRIDWHGAEPFFSSPAVFSLENGIVVEGADSDKATVFVQDRLGRF